MYKFILIGLLPLFLFGKSGILTTIVDGDTAILKDGDKNLVCHLGDLDALEMRENSKLKREIKVCKYSKKEFINAGMDSFEYAKKILKIGQTYEYTIPRYLKNRNPVCYLKIPKGLHVEIYPHFDQLMVSKGFALPYVIFSTSEYKKLLLKIAIEAKKQKRGLWKNHSVLMDCLVKQRYSLRSLR